MPPAHPVHEQVHPAQLVLAEEAVLVLLQLLRHVDELLIMHEQLADIAADLVDPQQIALPLRGEDLVLDLFELGRIALHEREVPAHDLLQKVIEKARQTRFAPALRAPDLGDHLLGLSAVVDEDDPFLIQREGKAEVVFPELRPVGDLEGARQGIIVDLGLGVVDVAGVRLQIDAHIKALALPLPFRRGQDRDVLTVGSIMQRLFRTGRDARFEQIVSHVKCLLFAFIVMILCHAPRLGKPPFAFPSRRGGGKRRRLPLRSL